MPCGCHRRATGMYRCRSTIRRFIFSPYTIRHLRYSTVQKIATAVASPPDDPTVGRLYLPEKSASWWTMPGLPGDLPLATRFSLLGDMNADPAEATAWKAIRQLLDSPRIKSLVPLGASGSDLTATFDLRVDYVLPSHDLTTLKTEVFWPERTQALSALLAASDHRLVWADIQTRAVPEPSTSCYRFAPATDWSCAATCSPIGLASRKRSHYHPRLIWAAILVWTNGT